IGRMFLTVERFNRMEQQPTSNDHLHTRPIFLIEAMHRSCPIRKRIHHPAGSPQVEGECKNMYLIIEVSP
ncbi:MAG: hypothetical protein K2G58_05570, partial [Alistipes sp.]|nr:hypothetical protein [Alistipes sp.]